MLIIKREKGSAIKIGDATTVTILGIEDNEVKLGIQAPRALAIERHDEISQDQRPRNGCTGLYRRGRIRNQG